jgi:predicted RecA/RadA family phage recombinase
MINFVQDGASMPYENSGSAISSGDVVVIGSRIGIAKGDIEATTGTGELALEGVFELDKTTSQAWSIGEALFWVTGTSKLSTVGTGNVFAGHCFEAAGSSATTGKVKLAAPPKQTTVIAALAGSLTGTVDGTLADVAAITDINLQLKELQSKLNAVIAAQKVSAQMANS